MTKYKVIIDPNAFKILNKHVMFLARVSTKSAHSLRNTFIKTVKSLEENPERYPLWLPSFKLIHPYHKIVIEKRYIILFYIDKSNVFVDYILDCRMDSREIF